MSCHQKMKARCYFSEKYYLCELRTEPEVSLDDLHVVLDSQVSAAHSLSLVLPHGSAHIDG